jgi:hypothetical protein
MISVPKGCVPNVDCTDVYIFFILNPISVIRFLCYLLSFLYRSLIFRNMNFLSLFQIIEPALSFAAEM